MSHVERAFNAKILLVIVLLFMLGSAASSAIQRVHGHHGSDLHLRLSQLCREEFFDVSSKGTLIGNYLVPALKGFKDYEDRFEFYPQNCTFTIRNFGETDDHNFTFTSYQSKVRMDFEVAVTDDLTSLPAPNMSKKYSELKANTTKEECISGLFALGLSLDPIICLVIILLADKIKQRSDGETLSCTQRAVLGKYDRNRINLGCVISKLVSLVCQAAGIILMEHCGGSTHEADWFKATISLTVIQGVFTAVWIYIAWKCDGGNMSSVLKNCPLLLFFLEWLQSLTFLFWLCFWYFSLYSASVTLCILIAFPPVSMILKILIFFLCRFMKRTTNPKEKSTSGEDDPLQNRTFV